jgi:glucose-6-phosphate isomerase
LAQQAKNRHIKSLFANESELALIRGERFSLSAANLYLDYSKQNITEGELSALITFAKQRNLSAEINALFSGEKLNNTENRAALHTVLRANKSEKKQLLGSTIDEVLKADKQFHQLVDTLISGEKKSITGKKFTDVLAIGIGGSFYGIKVAVSALTAYQKSGLNVHVLANVDGDALAEKLALLSAETTLVVIISKTFTTQETLLNAQAVKTWLLAAYPESNIVKQHCIAVSANRKLAGKFGIDAENILPMWDWVGGRFSIWSAVGLPLALAIGMENFTAFKQGAYEMDTHFKKAPFEQNMPVLMGLIGLWNRNFLAYSALAILPYSHALRALPGYLQQTDMESNGKSVTRQGDKVPYATAPIVFGQEGSNAQHAFMQMMHQSDDIIPTDFIVALQGNSAYQNNHQVLVANCFAQAEALMQGRSLEQVKISLKRQGLADDKIEALAAHKTMKGNTPSNMLVMDELSPKTLGALLALYEHKIFVQGILWQINSFDQWGVELGKALGTEILNAMNNDTASHLSSSSQKLIQHYKNLHQ